MPQNSFHGKKNILTIPNLLSLLRILLIPVIVWCYAFEESKSWTMLFLVLSGLTDAVDGFIARRFHMVSDVGKALDPIADKLTQAAVLICLVSAFPLMLLPVILLFVKEIVSGILALIAIRKTGEVVGADWHGKVTTVLLYAMMALHILWPAIPTAVSHLCIVICTAMMLLSFVLYSRRNMNTCRAHQHRA